MRLVAMCVDDRATYESAEMARVTDAVLAVNHDQVEDEEYDHDGTPQNGPLDRLVVQKHVRTEEAEDAVAGSARTNHHQAIQKLNKLNQIFSFFAKILDFIWKFISSFNPLVEDLVIFH